VVQPGSSSHTAAPCRLGRLPCDLLGESPARIQVLLDRTSSFAGTFGLMAEDRAMVAGVLGMQPDIAAWQATCGSRSPRSPMTSTSVRSEGALAHTGEGG
jgi:L-serine deaminase